MPWFQSSAWRSYSQGRCILRSCRILGSCLLRITRYCCTRCCSICCGWCRNPWARLWCRSSHRHRIWLGRQVRWSKNCLWPCSRLLVLALQLAAKCLSLWYLTAAPCRSSLVCASSHSVQETQPWAIRTIHRSLRWDCLDYLHDTDDKSMLRSSATLN